MLGVSMRLPEAADLGAALNSFIQANYTADEHRLAGKSLAEVQQLRTRMVASVARNAHDQDHAATLDVFKAYYRLLACLTARFPFQSASGSAGPPAAAPPAQRTGFLANFISKKPATTQVSLPTTWFDAFRHSNRVSDIDIAFEKYSVLFNVGSLYSRQATQIKSAVAAPGSDALQASPGADSSLKEACRLFQLSSGVFDYLSRAPEIAGGTLGHGASLDLTSESLSFLSTLMLAQAAACFFEKSSALASPKLVAKLAMGVSQLFSDAFTRIEKNARIKAILGKNDVYPWSSHCAYQYLCYQAAAHYWHAKDLLADDEYGKEIAHLERARNILAQAKKHEVGLLRNLGDNRTRLDQALASRLQVARADNERIYFSAIPQTDSVPHPESVTSVKALSFFDVQPDGITIDPSKDDPFTHLISPYLREQHDALRVKINEIQTGLVKKIIDAEQHSKQALQNLNLPAALDALADASSGSGLPDNVWAKVSEVQYKGGVGQLRELSSRIDSAVVDAQTAFDAAKAQLAKEAEMDATLRKQFAHRWNRRPSEQLTVNFQRDAESIQRFLRDADTSNAKVRAELDACLPKFELLALPQEELNARLPRATAEQSTASQASVATLRQLLASLAENTVAQKQLQTEFETLFASTDLMGALLATNATRTPTATANSESVSHLLEPFTQFDARFVALEAKQTELLRDITLANQTFLTHRSQDDTTMRRQAFLQEVNGAVASYGKLLANFNEGLKFYSDLLATKIGPFAQKIGDFAVARDMESKLILQQLTMEIASFKEEEKAPSAFPNASSSSSGGPAAAGIYAGAPINPAATNPNLRLDASSNLYQMNSPPPPAAASAINPHSQQPPPSQQQYSHPMQQASPYAGNPFAHVPSQPQYSQPPQSYQMPPGGAPYAYQQQQQQQAHPHQQQPQGQYPQAYAHPQPAYHQATYAPPPAQRPIQQSADPAGSWACQVCTYINPPLAPVCICGTKKP